MRRTVLWRSIVWVGTEWCALTRDSGGWELSGTVLAVVGSEPARVQYAVALDDGWSTREVGVDLWLGAGAEPWSLRMVVDQEQRWQIVADAPDVGPEPGQSEAFHGLVDIDLGFSPVTNTLPIRRLAPAIGEAVDVTAVWVRFPELTVEPLPQRYTRLDERRYRYESAGGAFRAELVVDDVGLVIAYENGWERLAEAAMNGSARQTSRAGLPVDEPESGSVDSQRLAEHERRGQWGHGMPCPYWHLWNACLIGSGRTGR